MAWYIDFPGPCAKHVFVDNLVLPSSNDRRSAGRVVFEMAGDCVTGVGMDLDVANRRHQTNRTWTLRLPVLWFAR